jgi:hypothetical protein
VAKEGGKSVSRSVQGLEWARVMEKAPHRAPRGLRGAKAKGVAFEKALLGALGPRARGGIWLEFCDSNGRGYCQPDILLKLSHQCLLILEAKYTWTWEGHQQLENLYRPVVRAALRGTWQILTVQVCKLLTPETPRQAVFASLEAALAASHAGKMAVCHWPCGALEPLFVPPLGGHPQVLDKPALVA